jgi:hypothetical protein
LTTVYDTGNTLRATAIRRGKAEPRHHRRIEADNPADDARRPKISREHSPGGIIFGLQNERGEETVQRL